MDLWQYLKQTEKPIVLYGMGNGADKIIAVLESRGIEYKGVFASDGFQKEKLFHGHKITSYLALKEKYGDMIVLLCFGSAREEVRQNVLKIAAEQELYAPEVAVVGGGLFCEEYYLANKERFDRVYSMLSDDISKKTFECIINYKLSGNIGYLLECEVDDDEPYESFLKLSDNEVFMDLGAYTGDTVADFVNRVKNYKSIIAAEPDIKNFRKLEKGIRGLHNTEIRNVGISDICGKKPFSMRGGRNSSTDKATGEIEFLNIDALSTIALPTYIKMDIEGEEVRAIKGAAKTISHARPKMLISAYHRTEDLFAIPEAVNEIRSDYKIYLRHFKTLPAWDTNFYFI